MDIWGIERAVLKDSQQIKDALSAMAAELKLEMTDSSSTETSQGGHRCFACLENGWVTLSTYPEQEIMMMDAVIHDGKGTAAAVGEYIFRHFGGAARLNRKSFLMERGIKSEQ